MFPDMPIKSLTTLFEIHVTERAGLLLIKLSLVGRDVMLLPFLNCTECWDWWRAVEKGADIRLQILVNVCSAFRYTKLSDLAKWIESCNVKKGGSLLPSLGVRFVQRLIAICAESLLCSGLLLWKWGQHPLN